MLSAERKASRKGSVADRDTVENLCYAGQVPVIPSMCETETGERLNVNADTAATAVAQALGAEKLVFLSDVNGVRRDKNDPDSLIHSLTAKDAPHSAPGSIESTPSLVIPVHAPSWSARAR